VRVYAGQDPVTKRRNSLSSGDRVRHRGRQHPHLWAGRSPSGHAGLDVLLARPGDVDTSALAASLSSALEAQGVVAPSVTIRAVEAVPHTAYGESAPDRARD
jgi:hypothetical protein